MMDQPAVSQPMTKQEFWALKEAVTRTARALEQAENVGVTSEQFVRNSQMYLQEPIMSRLML